MSRRPKKTGEEEEEADVIMTEAEDEEDEDDEEDDVEDEESDRMSVDESPKKGSSPAVQKHQPALLLLPTRSALPASPLPPITDVAAAAVARSGTALPQIGQEQVSTSSSKTSLHPANQNCEGQA
ncbi:hypothetical protein PG994_008425 [Apiospora phragmitis]|uniref:Uncharacterized protein n=1 Tax=Apiospora phragmitis TaxID=2905665 RepID=A0ABR1UGC4_9PEZI